MQYEDIWVKPQAKEQFNQYASLNNAMDAASPGTTIRVMEGTTQLTKPLKKGVIIVGLGKASVVRDSRGQLRDGNAKFVTIENSHGIQKYFAPTSKADEEDTFSKVLEEQRQIKAIAEIMGKKDQYPRYVYEYRFKFGKLKGKTADYAIEKEPKYLQWLYNNVDDLDPMLEKIMQNFSEDIGI